jgi:hypothetical protein
LRLKQVQSFPILGSQEFMIDIKIIKVGVEISIVGRSWQRFAGVIAALTLLLCAFAPFPALASNNYYDDGTATDVLSRVFESSGTAGNGTHSTCSSCHVGVTTSCNADGLTQTDYLNYTGARSCYARIRQKLANTTNGAQMPLSGPYDSNSDYLGYLTTWSNAGFALSPATVSGLNATPSKNSAVLGATFNTNTAGSGGFYFLEYGTTTGYGTTVFNNVTRNSTSPTSPTGNATSLACNTLHYYRARAGNGGGTSAYVTGTFTTTACTAPIITEGATTAVVMSEDSNPVPFSLTLNASDTDAGTLNWTIFSPAANGTASIAGGGTGTSEPIGYSPTPNYTGADSFQVRVSNATTGLSDTITVNVTVNPVNDPPIITEGTNQAVTMDEDSNPMPFSLTLNATDGDSVEANLSWSISSPATNGSAATAVGTGPSNVIGYTPNLDFNGMDSFDVQVSDGGAPDTITVNVTINPRNDAPVINAVGPQGATEGTLLTITPTVVDPDDLNNGSGQLTWSIVSGSQIGMLISNTGVITWTPPLGAPPPPAAFNQMYPITIRVADGLEHGSVPDDDAFVITVNPPDTDADLVADYNDFCPGAVPSPTSTDPTNADFDNDGTRGSDADPNDNVGGDVCDADDDNDGMPDAFEIANSLNPFDKNDADLDADGDGVSNLQEFLDGTNPNLANLVINATGYQTPYDLVPPLPTSIHASATAVTPSFASITPVSDNPTGPYRPGDNSIFWIPSNGTVANLAVSDPANLVSNPPTQPFFIRPLVSFGTNQQVEENAAVNVTLRLNGESPSWPGTAATVNYSVSGTASNPDDHDAVAGSVTFNDQEFVKTISFSTAADAISDPNETVVFEITGATNAVIGSKKIHTVTIVEANVAPRGSLQFDQGGPPALASAFASDNGGSVNIAALASDINTGQTMSYDWSGSDNALVPPGDTSTWSSAALTAGNYVVDVLISDDGTPVKSTRVRRILKVRAGDAATFFALDAKDTDGDGFDDVTEGYSDDDGDGIPNFLDNIDGTGADGNLVPDQTINAASSMLLETEPGLTLVSGNTSQAAGSFGALVTNKDIKLFGSASGSAPLNPDDDFVHVGGIYDFQILGLIPGQSANIVIPVQSAIPREGRYRKYNPASGWSDFVIDSNNSVASASGDLGACPEPGSSAYRSGLHYLDNCIQLTIEDGGPNDTDNQANGVINDPAAVGVVLKDPEVVKVKNGSGRLAPLLLAVLLSLGGFAFWRRRRGYNIDPLTNASN